MSKEQKGDVKDIKLESRSSNNTDNNSELTRSRQMSEFTAKKWFSDL